MTVDPAVAELVREVLAEELARLRRETREEWVRIADDADLAAFARRVLAMGEDPGVRDAFEGGSLVFRLDAGAGRGGAKGGRERAARAAGAPPPRAARGGGEDEGRGGSRAGEAGVETFEGGLLSERKVSRLPRGTARLRLGRTVSITPLARDRLRRLGITIERTET